MDFLKNTDTYDSFQAAAKCGAAGLFKEQAYLYLKTGKNQEAINVLAENCSEKLNDVVSLAM